jgi:plasmid maintenance system antidote protein VapI
MKYIPENIGDVVMLHVIHRFRGSQKAAAHHWGISRGVMSNILAGLRHPTPKMIEDLGMIFAYIPTEDLPPSAFRYTAPRKPMTRRDA